MNQVIQTKAGEIKIIDTWMFGRFRKCKAICFCGKEFEPYLATLKRGNTSSCGCYKSKKVSENRHKHGHSKTSNDVSKTYQSWRSMKAVCYNKNSNRYETNGGIGIKVCDEWLDFRNFLRDMGVKPANTMFCRADKDGDFEPDNCEWVPMKSRLSGKRYK